MLEIYQRLLQATQDGVYRYDFDDGRILFANQGFARLLDYDGTPESLVGRSLRDVMIYLEKEGFIRESLTRHGHLKGFEYHFRTLSGEDRWVVHDSLLQTDPLTGLEVVEAIVRDITQRKMDEEALRKSEERFRKILFALPDLLFRIDENGVFTDFHAARRDDLVVPPESFLGRTCDQVMPPEIAARTHLALAKALADGGVEVFEYSLEIGSETRHFEARLSAAGDREVLAVIREVTDRKRAEEALAAEKERLSVTLASIGDGVIATDRDGRVTMLNRVAEKLTGWTSHEAAGRPLSEVFRIINEKTREPCENPVDKVLASGQIIGLANHTALISRDGIERVIADSGSPIRDLHSRIIGVVLVFRDQTEASRLEEERQKTQKLESLGVLAGGIAHDFNNILTGVLGNVSLARTAIDPSERIYSRLIEAEKSLDRARDLTRQLLTFAKGGAPIRRLIEVGTIIRDSCVFAMSGSRTRCAVEIAGDLWGIEADPGQIGQVLQNLLLNADQSMPEGGQVTVRAENVKVAAGALPSLQAGDFIRITVQDQGIGISPQHMDRIFDPYFTTKQRGSGLGLSVCHSIVNNHDGAIRVESELGRGTTFHVYLPAVETAIGIGSAVEAQVITGRGRLLIMDDDDVIRKVAEAMITHLGYEVTMARDGVEAIDLFRNAISEGRPFDAVILDLTVPGGMGGKATMERLRALDSGVRAIVSSGYSNDPILAEHQRWGFKGFLCKPYQIEELGRVLGEVLASDETQINA